MIKCRFFLVIYAVLTQYRVCHGLLPFVWRKMNSTINIPVCGAKITNMMYDPQVAELGGTLGLFLGFSFLGFFDTLADISSSAINLFMKVSFWSGNKNI